MGDEEEGALAGRGIAMQKNKVGDEYDEEDEILEEDKRKGKVKKYVKTPKVP